MYNKNKKQKTCTTPSHVGILALRSYMQAHARTRTRTRTRTHAHTHTHTQPHIIENVYQVYEVAEFMHMHDAFSLEGEGRRD